MKGKKILSLIMAAAVMTSLSACGKSSSTDTSASKTSSTEISGEITVWSWNVAAKSLQIAATNFQNKYPKAKVTVVDGGNNNSVYDKLTSGLASKTGLPDVVSVEGDHVASYVSKFPDGFVDVTNDISSEKSNFLAEKLGELTLGGKVWGFPWDAAPSGIFYRTDMFKDAGVDPTTIKTWDDYIAAGKKIVAKTNGKVKMIPIDLKGDDPLYRQLLNQMGTFYFDKDGTTVLNGSESVKAMTLVKKMNDSGIVYNNDGWDSLVTATKTGLVATVPFGVWWAGTLQDQCKDSSGKWGVIPFPTIEGTSNTAAALGGSTVMIPSTTKNKALAVAFAKFAMTDKDSIMAGFKQYGLYPSYTPCYSDPMFDEGVEYFGGQKIWKTFADIAKNIPTMNFTENYAEAHTSVVNAQAKITLNKGDVKTTMDDLQKEVSGKFGK
jgi:lactose/L-arabinose transport system substrate-binding protein